MCLDGWGTLVGLEILLQKTKGEFKNIVGMAKLPSHVLLVLAVPLSGVGGDLQGHPHPTGGRGESQQLLALLGAGSEPGRQKGFMVLLPRVLPQTE